MIFENEDTFNFSSEGFYQACPFQLSRKLKIKDSNCRTLSLSQLSFFLKSNAHNSLFAFLCFIVIVQWEYRCTLPKLSRMS